MGRSKPPSGTTLRPEAAMDSAFAHWPDRESLDSDPTPQRWLRWWLQILSVSSHQPAFRRREQRSEEHTSELQSLRHLVCRLLLEKKKNITYYTQTILSKLLNHNTMSTYNDY